MHGYRKTSVSAQRFAARRQQEDDAPRLSSEVPQLVSLRLSIGGSAGMDAPPVPTTVAAMNLDLNGASAMRLTWLPG